MSVVYLPINFIARITLLAMNNLSKNYVTKSAEQTRAIGAEIVALFSQTNVICLYGDLGAGKTTIAQGIAKALGITRRIISPTFVIVRKYELPKEQNFYHVDLYRVASEQDLEELGLGEILGDKQNIVVIEWAEKLGTLLPEKRIEIVLEYLDTNQRKIIAKRTK